MVYTSTIRRACMKSTLLDKEVLELLIENREGLPLYKMARVLNRNPSNLHRKLQKLIKHNLIIKIKSNVAIYKIGCDKQPTVYFKVICPKCGTISTADYIQLTKVCPNKDCLTKKGGPTRFIIETKRIVDKIVI